MSKSYLLLPFLIALLIGSGRPAADYSAMDERGDPFRTEFNAAVGKIRVVMLVAPT